MTATNPPPAPTGPSDGDTGASEAPADAPGPDRRGLLVGLGTTAVAGVAGYAVASRDRSVSAGGSGQAAPPAAGGDTSKPLAALADVPAGGGAINKAAKVVVVRDGDQVR